MIDSITEKKIHAAINIVDVISQFIELKRKGQNYIGLCPFHDDKSPSLYVSPARRTYKCFSCGAGGDAIDFLYNYRGMKYFEAMKWLADRYGIPMQQETKSKEQYLMEKDKESMFLINDIVMTYYESCLANTDNRAGMKYLQSRGINEETIRAFHLGYCPINSDVISVVRSQNADMKFLFRGGTDVSFKSGKSLHVDNGVGIVYRQEESGRFFDVYRGRVIFPWFDRQGSVVGFGGRCLDSATKGVERKYVNSPESIIYHKANELYGFYQAVKAILQEDRVYIVEGYLDVLTLYQLGIRNVVSTSGTVLTAQQVQLLLHYTKNIVLGYDSDSAGMGATLKSIDILLHEGANVSCLSLPEGEDPASFAKSLSEEEAKAYFSTKAEDFLDYMIRILIHPEDEPIAANNAIRKVLKSLSQMPDAILRELYLKKLVKVCGIREDVLSGAFKDMIKG